MLTMLRQHPEMTQTELARRMGIEVPTVFKALKRLEEGGYLERVADKLDRRARTLRLTAEGLGVLAEIDAFNPIRDNNLLADFTPAERRQFRRLLTKLIVRGAEHLGISQAVVVGAPPDVAASVAREDRPQRGEQDVEPSAPASVRRRAAGWRSQNGFRRRRANLKS
jgi:DNA-binding MarR family transcriptional regulator